MTSQTSGQKVPIPKSNNLSQVSNYRGISLSQMLKVVNRMILNRIQPILYPMLRTKQNGFRPGRSTTAQILTLRGIVEAIRARNLPAVITFIGRKEKKRIEEKLLILSTGERCFRFSRPMASPHCWWMPLVKPTRKQGLMSSPLTVNRIIENHQRRIARSTH